MIRWQRYNVDTKDKYKLLNYMIFKSQEKLAFYGIFKSTFDIYNVIFSYFLEE